MLIHWLQNKISKEFRPFLTKTFITKYLTKIHENLSIFNN